MERKYGSSHFPLTPVLLLLREMATLTDFFKRASPEDYIAASFSTREHGIGGRKTVKRPVGETVKAPTGTIDPEQWPGEGRQAGEHPGGTCSC